jgi:type I restriction enzyme, S subunit
MSEPIMACLPDVAEIIMGQSPPGDTYNETGNGMPFFQGKAEFGKVSPTPKKWCSAPNKIAEAGDILMSVRAPVGPTNLASTQCCIGRGLAAIRANPQLLDPSYLRFALRHAEPRLASMGQGSTFAAIGRAELAKVEFPLPPIAEQRRIVDILSRAEGIVRLRREAEKKAAELIPALFLDMFGDPATNPKGWPVGSLGEHVEIVSAVKTPDLNQDANFPCIGADSIESHTGKLISLPTVSDVQPISGKYQFKLGDVLYSKIRPYLAKASLAPCKGYCSADMYPLNCKPSLRADFLLALLLSKSFTEYATAESVRAQMPKLNRQTLFAYQFPVPAIELQERFSERANFAYSIQSQQTAATAMAQATFDSLLSQMFSQ